jgi:hypothetical protein
MSAVAKAVFFHCHAPFPLEKSENDTGDYAPGPVYRDLQSTGHLNATVLDLDQGFADLRNLTNKRHRPLSGAVF